MVRRKLKVISKDKRIGMRKRSTGRPCGMDEEDERFLLQCIESKTTAHGRRTDTVMYSGQRVKKKDFLRIVNHNRHLRGLKHIKSATTAYNRSRPRKKNSKSKIQSKRHVGADLFCSKKPPETADNENGLTHYQ